MFLKWQNVHSNFEKKKIFEKYKPWTKSFGFYFLLNPEDSETIYYLINLYPKNLKHDIK